MTYKITKILFLSLVISLSLYGCSFYPQNLHSSNGSAQSYDYTLPADKNSEDCHSGNNRTSTPLVTNTIPDNNMYPLSYGIYGQTTFMINQNIYFLNNGTLYESTATNSPESWNTTSLGIETITDLLSDGTYLYCLTHDNAGIIYNPVSHSIKCQVSFQNFFNSNHGSFELNCVGNDKGYFSTADYSNADETHIIFTLDQNGQIEILNSSDDSHFIKAVYSDSEYFVYESYSPNQDNSNFYVYVHNLQTNETYQICDQKIINMKERNAPFYRWNNSFVFLISGKGICIADTDGGDVHIYIGDTSHGYVMYENKMYFAASQIVSIDLSTGEEERLTFSNEDDFVGNINICDGIILLSRKEASSENMTVHVLPIS